MYISFFLLIYSPCCLTVMHNKRPQTQVLMRLWNWKNLKMPFWYL